jgi:N-acyl-D-amino-acid deacylase
VADVAVKGGRIVEVGPHLAIKGAREVDAAGKHVTPGWVDPHTHYDAQVMWDPMVSPSSANGVTTVVMGNCAVGIAPCQQPLRGFVTDLCDAIEDIPSKAIESLEDFWQWETFPEYMAVMEEHSFACDVGVLVGHAAVRTWVLGARANASDLPGGMEAVPVSTAEVADMRKVVEEAVAAGAVGFSSSRVSIHRDHVGVLLPGSLASHEELLEMGRGVTDGGGGVFELASSWNLYDDFVKEGQPDPKRVKEYGQREWRWLSEMSMIDGLSVTTGGGNGMTPETAWSHTGMLTMLDKVTAAGGDMMVTPMMRLGTLFMGIHSEGLNPLRASATFQELLATSGGGGRVSDEMLLSLQTDPQLRESICAELTELRSGAYGTHFIGLKTMRQWVWSWSTDPENKKENSLEFAPAQAGKTVWEYVYDVMVHPEQEHGGVLVRPLYNYGEHSMEPLRDMFQHERVVAGFADGGAHGKGQNEATTPTTMITFWCRDRSRGERLPIELVVQKQTRDSARMMGYTDRGTLEPGMRADLNVFDLNRLDVLPPVRGIRI